jgi:hypothetical protein
MRGPVMRWWLRRSTQILTKQYQAMLLNTASKPNRTPPAQPKAPKPDLRNLLFICCNMWEKRELLPELQKICEVTFVDISPETVVNGVGSSSADWYPKVEPRLKALKSQRFDAVVIYLNGALLCEEVLDLVRRSWSCPVLGLNLDDKTTYTTYDAYQREAQNYRRWAPHFDCNLTNSRSIIDVYHSEGHPCLYLPTGFHFDPKLHEFPEGAPAKYPLSFVGSRKPERGEFIDEIRRRGVDVALFGQGWEGAQYIDEGWKVFRMSQINLGLGYNIPGTTITNLKNRDFECPGVGGCYLTTYDWELAELFDVGKEILCYRDVDEFIEVYSHYIVRPERCRKIARAGYERATRDHTWEQRFRKVFRQLGFAA